jgi:hypothetical protein
VAVAGYEALETKHHNAFSRVEEMLGAHGDINLGDVTATKGRERKGSKNEQLLDLGEMSAT